MYNKPKGFIMVTTVVRQISLELETRTALTTRQAAFELNRSEQTLRIWACRENGPIRPLRVNGRLHWKTDDIRCLLGLAHIAAPAGRPSVQPMKGKSAPSTSIPMEVTP